MEIARAKNQESTVGKEELEGYTDYTNEARYRLLPGIW